MSEDIRKAIRDYWEDPSTISIIDKNLHGIEIDTVCRHLLPGDRLADIGCGDGEATVRYAREVKECVAFEPTDRLRAKAEKRFAEENLANLSLLPGDILDMGEGEGAFDSVVTQRTLINLASWGDQQQALMNIHRMLKPGGRYIMIENTNDASEALNAMRTEMGLKPIPQHWHNRFFDYDDLMDFMSGRFELRKEYDFGLYYFLTRVYVPMFASFTGSGAKAKKDPIFDVSDAAARRLFEAFAERVKIGDCRALGPVQGFVFRRLATD